MRRALIALLFVPSLAFAGWTGGGSGVAQPSDVALTLGQVLIGGSNGRAAAVSVTGDLTLSSTGGAGRALVVSITNPLPSLTATTINATNAILSGSLQTATANFTTGGYLGASTLAGGTVRGSTSLSGTVTNTGLISGGTVSGATMAGATTLSGTVTGGTINPAALQIGGTTVNSFTITGTASATVNFGVIGALGGSSEQLVSVPGCVTGDRVDLGLPSNFASTILAVKYRIAASGTVGLTAFSVAGLTDSNHTVTITTHNP